MPGSNPATTALRSLLAHHGVVAPHSGRPFSEAMLLGIAGGIGAGVFTFHYANEGFSSFFLAGRHLWQDDLAFLGRLAAASGSSRRFSKPPARARQTQSCVRESRLDR